MFSVFFSHYESAVYIAWSFNSVFKVVESLYPLHCAGSRVTVTCNIAVLRLRGDSLMLPGIAVSTCVLADIITQELNGIDEVQTCHAVSQLQTKLALPYCFEANWSKCWFWPWLQRGKKLYVFTTGHLPCPQIICLTGVRMLNKLKKSDISLICGH